MQGVLRSYVSVDTVLNRSGVRDLLSTFTIKTSSHSCGTRRSTKSSTRPAAFVSELTIQYTRVAITWKQDAIRDGSGLLRHGWGRGGCQNAACDQGYARQPVPIPPSSCTVGPAILLFGDSQRNTLPEAASYQMMSSVPEASKSPTASTRHCA